MPEPSARKMLASEIVDSLREAGLNASSVLVPVENGSGYSRNVLFDAGASSKFEGEIKIFGYTNVSVRIGDEWCDNTEIEDADYAVNMVCQSYRVYQELQAEKVMDSIAVPSEASRTAPNGTGGPTPNSTPIDVAEARRELLSMALSFRRSGNQTDSFQAARLASIAVKLGADKGDTAAALGIREDSLTA